MKTNESNEGFRSVEHDTYLQKPHDSRRVVAESSAMGDYDDAFDSPGSSFLWFGTNHHFNREEVTELIERMQHWLDHKRLKMDEAIG